MVKLPEAWLPAESVAVQETVVVPTGKVYVPEAGTEVEPMLQLTVAVEQVSEAVTAYGAEAPEQESAGMVADSGRVSTGGVVSRMATEKLHCAWLHESAAVQVTVVEPSAKVAPELAEQVALALAEHEGELQEAAAPAAEEHSATTLLGQLMVADGGAVTVTLNEPEALLPAVSVAVQETVVVPTGKVYVPEAGTEVEPMLQLTVAVEHVSVAVTQYGTAAPVQVVAATVLAAGRLRTGLVVSWTVTEKLHWVCAHESAALQVTLVEPIGKGEPD